MVSLGARILGPSQSAPVAIYLALDLSSIPLQIRLDQRLSGGQSGLSRELAVLVEVSQEAIKLLFEEHARPGPLYPHRVPLIAEALDLGLAEPELAGIAVA